MRRVSPREAQALIEREGYAYLDVRSVAEFDAGHPPAAYNVPLKQPGEAGMVPNEAFAREVAAVFDRSARIVVGCASGVRSREALSLLAGLGFEQLVEQRAGMEGVRDPFGRIRERGWRDEGLPVTTATEPARSHREIAARARQRD